MSDIAKRSFKVGMGWPTLSASKPKSVAAWGEKCRSLS